MKPTLRIAVDWDGDGFICYDTRSTDALNRLHTGLSDSDPNYTNLHFGYVNTSAINSSTVTVGQEFTAYGIRKLNCVTGTNTTAGAYFGRTGSTNDFTVTNGQTYTAVCWIKATVGSGTSMLLAMENSTGSTSFTISTSWQKVTRTFTATGTTTAFSITKNTSATNVTFEVTGFMIVSGSTAPNGFNVGDSSNGYDVITADIRTVNWTIGKNNWQDLMPSEGVARIEVNNDDRKYSPEYSSSVLYGKMQQKRLVTIDVYKPSSSAWVRKFAGWTQRYLPAYGKNRDNVTVITCEQGMFRLREIRYRKTVSDSATADTIIQNVLFDGFVFANTPLQCRASGSNLNASYFIDPDAVMTLDTGVSTINLSAEAWADRDNAEKVIEQLMNVERGWFFLMPDGTARFYNRHHFADPALTPSTIAFDIDTSGAVDGDYRHSEAFYNVVKLNYYPFTQEEDQTVYLLRERPLLRPRQSKEIEVRFEREEGRRYEVESVNAFGTEDGDSTLTVVSKGGRAQTGRLRAEFIQTDGRSGRLILSNGPGAKRRVTYLALKGTTRESFGGQTLEVSSDDGVNGTYILTESSKLITTESEADNMARFLLTMHDTARGEFDSINLINRTQTALEKQLDNGIGSKISVSEYQTGHSGTYVVVGEQHTHEPGLLRTKFVLEPLGRRPDVWVLGTSALGSATYLAY